ncbi:hypothetical protein [Mycobacterium asiaticum]|uniref:hypothetical protein n=1 Tax=Mycobacterium asiaticum TaxID=1790 RepID=UPI0012DB7A75|nr:hypothetical protein [Mycobacterium asiaticum]
MKRYVAGEPYSARRVTAFQRRIERLARRVHMVDLLAEGPDAFIGFQDDLARLQAEIQRDIGELKKTVRKDKKAIPALDWLRRLRWYSRCLGDALAWEVLLFDRKTIAALMTGTRQPIAAITTSHQAVVSMAGYLLSQQFGVPIIHDITNWLRIGDITFMQPKKEGKSWGFQTVELKSSVNDSETLDDGVIQANVTVNVYSNEPMDLLKGLENTPKAEAAASTTPENLGATVPAKQDRRLKKQFQRLDKMIAQRDMKDNAITTVDGIPNVVFRLPHEDTHHWADLRRAIRNARRDGCAFFSIDHFIGYTIFYRKEGVTEEHISKFREPMVEHVQNDLLAHGGGGFLLVRELPMAEEYDVEGFPFMRFFSYKIPQNAIADLLRNRLLMVATVNYGLLDAALAERGFNVTGMNGEPRDDAYPYSCKVAWPTGETFRLGMPSSQVSREVERALYEFSGLDDVVQKVASVQLLPDLISYADFEASLEAQAAHGEAVQQNKPV